MKSQEKKKAKSTIVLLLIIAILIAVIAGYVAYRSVKKDVLIETEWGEKYFVHLKDIKNSLTNSDVEAVHGIQKGAEDVTMKFCETTDNDVPKMVLNYSVDEKRYATIYYIDNDAINYTAYNQPSEVTLLFNIEINQYIWYLHITDGGKEYYKALDRVLEEVNSATDGQEVTQDADYTFTEEEMQSEKEEKNSKFDETFIVPEIEDKSEVELDFSKDDNELKSLVNDSVNNFKPKEELITEEIESAVEEEKVKIEEMTPNYTKIEESQEIVYTGWKIDFEKGYVWPKINIVSDDVTAINAEIQKDYQNYQDDFDMMGIIYDGDIQNYQYFVNDNILSVVIVEEGNDTNDSMTYNIDLKTGKRLSNDELYKLKKIDKTELVEKAKNAVKTLYDAVVAKDEANGAWANLGKYYAEEFEQYIETQDYANADAYLDENGKLCLICYYEELGGQEYCLQGAVVRIEEDFKAEDMTIEKIANQEF